MRTSNGVPNKDPNACSLPFFAFENMFLSAIGWNCRALCHHDKHLRDLKIREVLALCKEFDIVGLCEVHGNHTQLLSYLSFCTRTHFLFSSHVRLGNGDPNLSSGGICLLVHKKFFCSPSPPESCFQSIEDGRAVELTLMNPQGAKHISVSSCTILVSMLPLPPESLGGLGKSGTSV